MNGVHSRSFMVVALMAILLGSGALCSLSDNSEASYIQEKGYALTYTSSEGLTVISDGDGLGAHYILIPDELGEEYRLDIELIRMNSGDMLVYVPNYAPTGDDYNWCINQDRYKISVYQIGNTVNFGIGGAANVKFYIDDSYITFKVHRNVNAYETTATLAFDSGGGNNTPETMTKVMVGQLDLEGDVRFTIPEQVPTYSGREFLGWSLEEGGDSVDYLPGQEISVSKIDEVTLYAVWKSTAFTVIFDSNGGSAVTSQIIESGDCALSPEDPTLYGFVFKGWFTDDGTFQNEWDFTDPVTGNMTLYAKWEGNLEFTTDPVADGKVTAVEGSPGTAVFAATDSQNYNTVLWDFGDGTTSTNTYVTHYYSQPGTYTATLTVYNNHGNDTMEFLIEVPGDDSGDGVPWTIVIAAVLTVVIIGALIARYLL